MKKLSKIKNSFVSRNSGLLKLALKSGMGILKNSQNPTEILKTIIGKDPAKFTEELSLYKGSIMKAGQLLSLYGEYYLPKELNVFLEALRSQSHYIDFDIIKSTIPARTLNELTFEKTPLAAASIGQVHLAKDSLGNEYAVKIQYKGIKKAIDTDIFFLKLFFKTAKVLPKGMNFDSVFDEVRKNLELETDYHNEARMIKAYRENLNKYDLHEINTPIVNVELSTEEVIVLSKIEGVTLDQFVKTSSDQKFKNNIAQKLFEIFLHEIFNFNLVQTDAHGGNYLIDDESKTLGLIDFGACVEYSKEDIKFYQNFLKYSVAENKELFLKSMRDFFSYTENKMEYDEDLLWQYVTIATDPVREESYNWAKTNLPDRLFDLGMKLQATIKAKKVPHQFVFIDRKVIGLFSLMRSLEAEFSVKASYEQIVKS
ncbi:AarF/ABC1/UbiB kinase family protein [Bacteriovorax sp. Seq25_V]|uniref:ABC1 kinase family protein n=1 Tax=Bacteriovorax sp. Seq25_V TaxID=1201288 RepID=UPI00040DAC73|nr:AarF/ABC1/UbiB kinase family protein [Bacteriovorax sp. Seq25_V]